MTDLKLFLSQNKIKRENKKYAATKSICDTNGNPVEWEIRPLTSEEVERIRNDYTREVQVTGKPGQYRPKVDVNGMTRQMIVDSVVFPDLLSAELQDSYGVQTPQELLMEIMDNPGEYTDFSQFIQEINGFIPLDTKVEEAKN